MMDLNRTKCSFIVGHTVAHTFGHMVLTNFSNKYECLLH